MTQDSCAAVDRLLEPQTIKHFLQSVSDQVLPNGKPYSQPIPAEADVMLMVTPWADWALPPYNNLPEAPVNNIMTRIGSHEDSDRMVINTQPNQHLKARLWEGIVPISNERWKAMQLDDPEFHRMACEHLGSVITTFNYLNYPTNADNLRVTFNLISKHLEDFSQALNMVQSRQDDQPVSMPALWFEFMSARYQVMTTRAHDWIISHALPLMERISQDLQDFHDLHSSESTTYGTSMEELDLSNRFHDLLELVSRADHTIFMPMNGYNGYIEPAESPPLYDSDHDKRIQNYHARRKELTFPRLLFPILDQNGSSSLARTTIAQREGCDGARIELRGTPEKINDTTWIRYILHQRRLARDRGETPAEATGFIAYRLAHKHSDEQWNEFRQKFEADLADWGEGIDLAADIKGLLKLHWFDGKEIGVEDGDINAAREHFLTLTNSPDLSKEINFDAEPEIFLAIDSTSIDSYLSPPSSASSSLLPNAVPGDSTQQGHVLAVDSVRSNFDPTHPEYDAGRFEETPEYAGHTRILGGLVWSDLFAMIKSETQWTADLWPCARENPRGQVYVGPVAEWMRKKWKGTGEGNEPGGLNQDNFFPFA